MVCLYGDLFYNSGMDKKECRKELIGARKNVTDKLAKSQYIAKEVASFCSSYQVIGVYLAKEDEVQTDDLILDLLSKNKIVVVPKIVNEEMVFIRINSLDNFVLSKFNVREPINGEIYSKDKIDAIIIPGLGFDIHRNRIGYGKGYYDRYLADYQGKKIGICFYDQLVMNLPTESNDIQIDILFNEHLVI